MFVAGKLNLTEWSLYRLKKEIGCDFTGGVLYRKKGLLLLDLMYH